jgi:hypothetical protein
MAKSSVRSPPADAVAEPAAPGEYGAGPRGKRSGEFFAPAADFCGLADWSADADEATPEPRKVGEGTLGTSSEVVPSIPDRSWSRSRAMRFTTGGMAKECRVGSAAGAVDSAVIGPFAFGATAWPADGPDSLARPGCCPCVAAPGYGADGAVPAAPPAFWL